MSIAPSCCAEFYEQDWVRLLLGDSFHPGGIALSRRSIASLALPAGARVVELAAGCGTTAIELARAGHHVTAVDQSQSNLARGREAATAANLDGNIEFVQGDVSALPFNDNAFDAALIECAVSTFADKRRVAGEVARVLRPGGRLAISDMAVKEPLPPEFLAFAGPWACIEDAQPVRGYQSLFLDAGLRVLEAVDESDSLLALSRSIKRKLVLAGVGSLAGLPGPLPFSIGDARRMLATARELVERGAVEYCRLTFSNGKPAQRTASPARPQPVACDPSTGCC